MKLVAQDGREVFDFKNDDLGCAVLWKIATLAKFQCGLDSTVSLNPLVNSMMQAVGGVQTESVTTLGAHQEGAEETDLPGIRGLSDERLETSPEIGSARLVLTTELPRLRWWELADSTKLERVRDAVYPYLLNEQQQRDMVEELDHFVAQFRDRSGAEGQRA